MMQAREKVVGELDRIAGEARDGRGDGKTDPPISGFQAIVARLEAGEE